MGKEDFEATDKIITFVSKQKYFYHLISGNGRPPAGLTVNAFLILMLTPYDRY